MSGIIDDILGNLNYVDRIEGLIMSLRHGDYARARRSGLLGIVIEVVSSMIMANTRTFAISRSGNFTLNEVEAMLRKYGISIFGRTHDARCMYFHVKLRQARWAEYLMLQAGVELESPIFDSRNVQYAGQHAPGWMPRPWIESARSTATDSHPPLPSSEVKRQRQQASRVDSWLDDLEQRLL